MCDALNFVYVQKVKKKKSADGEVDIDEDGVDFEMQPVISIDLDKGGYAITMMNLKMRQI